MNKKTKQFVQLAIVILIVMYLGCAFIYAEPNPFEWSESIRGGFVGIYVLGLLLDAAVTYSPE